MKLTKTELEKIIKEELALAREGEYGGGSRATQREKSLAWKEKKKKMAAKRAAREEEPEKELAEGPDDAGDAGAVESEEEIPQDKLIAELGGLLDKLNTRFKMIKGEAFPALMKNIVSRMLQGGPNNGRVKVNDARLLFKDLYNTIGKE